MKIYLVRHGIPTSTATNPEKPLSAEGRKEVEAVGNFLKGHIVQLEKVYHSGKARARDTAEILVDCLDLNVTPQARTGLAPMDEVIPLAKELKDCHEPIMLVGHLPFLARLTSFLTTGDSSQFSITFSPATVVCLERNTHGEWLLEWIVKPYLVM